MTLPTNEQAEALANYIRRYWEGFGATVTVTVRPERWSGFELRVQMGPDGLPRKWKTPKHKHEYVAKSRTQMRALILYINSEILPPHNRMSLPHA